MNGSDILAIWCSSLTPCDTIPNLFYSHLGAVAQWKDCVPFNRLGQESMPLVSSDAKYKVAYHVSLHNSCHLYVLCSPGYSLCHCL